MLVLLSNFIKRVSAHCLKDLYLTSINTCDRKWEFHLSVQPPLLYLLLYFSPLIRSSYPRPTPQLVQWKCSSAVLNKQSQSLLQHHSQHRIMIGIYLQLVARDKFPFWGGKEAHSVSDICLGVECKGMISPFLVNIFVWEGGLHSDAVIYILLTIFGWYKFSEFLSEVRERASGYAPTVALMKYLLICSKIWTHRNIKRRKELRPMWMAFNSH